MRGSRGRTLTAPGATGALSLGYFDNDMVSTETQGSWSMAYTLDPTQDRIATATAINGAASTQTVNDYSDNTDSPAWSTTGGAWTREVTGPDGQLDATVSQSGTVTLDLGNLDGSEVATAADATTDTGANTDSYASYGPFGTPTDTTASGETGYGWEGGAERSADSLGGLILMGARLYNPGTGRFLSVDPVYGGNANPYIYPTNPIDNNDLAGHFSATQRVRTRNLIPAFTWLDDVVDALLWVAPELFEMLNLMGAVAATTVAILTCIAYGGWSRARSTFWAVFSLAGPLAATGRIEDSVRMTTRAIRALDEYGGRAALLSDFREFVGKVFGIA